VEENDAVFEHRQERRTRNRLLMRELLLRLDAERRGAPGKSGTPTVYFREWKRRMMLRNPSFALHYLVETRRSRRESVETRRR
jgi:hypothetical protein